MNMQGDSSSIADDVSGEYAAILGIKPEKYQTKVLLFQVRPNVRFNMYSSLYKFQGTKCEKATLARMDVPSISPLLNNGNIRVNNSANRAHQEQFSLPN